MNAAFAYTVLSTDNSGYISVANDAGAFYGISSARNVSGVSGQITHSSDKAGMYYYDFSLGGGGLNQLHIGTAATTTSNSNLSYNAVSGSYDNNFWLTTTGGKGGNDDLILCVALTGPISSNFSLNVVSNGYVAAPGTARPTITAANWQNNVVNETFYGSDFIYGPQTTRIAQTDQALYNGQGSATGYLMFIDLGVANRNYSTALYGTNGGSDQVVFNVNGLYDGDVLAFSIYDYDLVVGNTGSNFIGWTNQASTNSYTIVGAGTEPPPPQDPPTNNVPEPQSLMLLGFGLMSLVGFNFKRRG